MHFFWTPRVVRVSDARAVLPLDHLIIVSILWILLPAPFVGYFVIDHFRKLISDDPALVRKVFESQPVTMIAAATALGSVVVWAVSEIVMRLFRAFF